MSVSRREFIKYCATLSGTLGLASTDLLRLGEVLAGRHIRAVVVRETRAAAEILEIIAKRRVAA